MAKVLLVAEQEQQDALVDALTARGLEVRACLPKEAARSVGDAQVVAVSAFPADATAAKFVAHLQSSLGADAIPVVVTVAADAGARDAALIAGAADVSFGSSSEALAACVFDVLSPWRRGTPVAKFVQSVRAQSGRAQFELRVADLDVSGIGLEANPGLVTGQLLRMQLPLGEQEFMGWGRAVVDEEGTGIRFIARSASERAHVEQAAEACASQVAVSQAVAPPVMAPPVMAPPVMAPPVMAPQAIAPPVMAPQAAPPAIHVPDSESLETDVGSSPPESAQPAPTIVEDGSAEEKKADNAPTEPQQPNDGEPTVSSVSDPAKSPEEAAVAETEAQPRSPSATSPTPEDESATDAASPAADEAQDTTDSGTSTDVPGADENADTSQPRTTSFSSAIGDALDDALGLSSDDATEDAAAVVERDWPSVAWDTKVCVEVLRTAASLSLASDVEGAPRGATVLAFLRTVSPLERRVFSQDPPTELPPVEVSERCLALRLRCFAHLEETRSNDGDDVRWRVCNEPIAALKAEVEQARSEIQKVVDALVAEAETGRIHDTNLFANSLNKAFGDVAREAGRLNGEYEGPSANAALLDVAEPGADQAATLRRKPRQSDDKRPEEKASGALAFKRSTPQQRARQRLVNWLIVLLVAIGVRIALWPEGTKTLTPEDLRGLVGVVEIKVPPAGRRVERPQAAVVTVTAGWRPDEASVEKLRAMLRAKGIERFAVFNSTGDFLAIGGTGAKAALVLGSVP